VRKICLLLVGACAALAACTGADRQAHIAQPPTRPAPTTSTSTSVPPTASADKTVWLCRPGAQPDPCEASLAATAVGVDGSRSVEKTPPTARTDLDCFYVYPTVSEETTPNADLRIQPAETNTAIAQASRFSTTCRVWAPMYRQRTVSDLFNGQHGAATSAQNQIALASLRAAWRDYLAHDNDGRRVVLIGHSQGAAMLIRLITQDIDPNPVVRRKVALALLLGGNVTVANGARLGGGLVGGSFQHLPLCTRKGESGCVIAYSSFPAQPPAFSLFGRAGAGVSLLAGETATNRQVACVNPAAIAGGAAMLHPYIPSEQVPTVGVTTPWASFPGTVRAECRHAGTATWLQVAPTRAVVGRTQLLTQRLGPAWGYHVVDVNIALGDLVADVAAVAH
jgi:hypothetical protein